MINTDIRDKCSINSNYDTDTFVGIKCENGDISINFPLGYNLSDNDNELRKDILNLFSVLAKYSKSKDSTLSLNDNIFNNVDFPIQSYIYIIKDFIQHGYYTEKATHYKHDKRGKINWNKTVKQIKPIVQNNNLLYLDFIVKHSSIKENELITLIHEYIVYNSFLKLGWLFNQGLPKKPSIKYNYKLFTSVIKTKLNSTFEDKYKTLFRHMLAILQNQGNSDANTSFRYGTYRFEYIWESMIDTVFGNTNKENYFPKTYWNINSNIKPNASLMPDTIMIDNSSVYILDAKYYKYGVTEITSDLPESTSINKQITYGEYVYTQDRFKQKFGINFNVYNAFIMPFNASKGSFKGDSIIKIGEAFSDWKSNNKDYQRVQAILLDTKTLMNITDSQNPKIIQKLIQTII